MAWRSSWARNWDTVRYCSDRCRRRKVTDEDRELERAILALLDDRARGSSICPSDAARAVDGAGWPERMDAARSAARRLVAAGEVEITQGGRVVDPSTARGPIRIRKAVP